MTRARDVADLIGVVATDAELASEVSAINARKNLLYNGAMQVHQRGTSAAGITGTGYYTADRFNWGNSSLGTWTHTIENDAPTGSGFRKSFKALCTTADVSPSSTNFVLFQQQLEGLDVQSIRKGTSSAQKLTLSFWVKSNTTGNYVVELDDINNTRGCHAYYSVDTSNTWEYKTITFPADTTGTFDNNNGASLRLSWWLGAGSNFTSGTLQETWGTLTAANRYPGGTNLAAAVNNYWQITGVQFEVGDTATDFEHKPYGVELAECQRYYQILFNWSDAASYAAVVPHGQTNARMFFSHIQTFRASPTIAIPPTNSLEYYSGTNAWTAINGMSISAFTNMTQLNILVDSMPPNGGNRLIRNTSGNLVTVTADAEL